MPAAAKQTAIESTKWPIRVARLEVKLPTLLLLEDTAGLTTFLGHHF